MQRSIPNDHLKPILAYRQLGGPGCCLLESAFEEKLDNRSFLGIEPTGTFCAYGRKIEVELLGEKRTFEGDPYEALKEFSKGRATVGFVAYDAVRVKEKLPDRHPKRGIPDFFFHVYKTTLRFNHETNTILFTHDGTEEELDAIIEKLFSPASLKPFKGKKIVALVPDIPSQEYEEIVEKAKEHIRAGDIFQIVPSRTFKANIQAKPFDVYRALRQVSPAPYHFFFEENEFAIAGASPERLISVQDGRIESMPIAGTSPKGADPQVLLGDAKECAEHVMLVDLARNDLGAVSLPGTVEVLEFKKVKAFSHLNHIVSRVAGTLDPKLHALDAFKASFPAGTLSGAPKIRAMELIDGLERQRRGLYGGAIVSLDEQGNLMSCIAIRTAFLKDGVAEVRAGGGVVLDSDPAKEEAETRLKSRNVHEALELAEGTTV